MQRVQVLSFLPPRRLPTSIKLIWEYALGLWLHFDLLPQSNYHLEHYHESQRNCHFAWRILSETLLRRNRGCWVRHRQDTMYVLVELPSQVPVLCKEISGIVLDEPAEEEYRRISEMQKVRIGRQNSRKERTVRHWSSLTMGWDRRICVGDTCILGPRARLKQSLLYRETRKVIG